MSHMLRSFVTYAQQSLLISTRSAIRVSVKLTVRPTPTRTFSASAMIQDPFKPAARVAGQRQDVW